MAVINYFSEDLDFKIPFPKKTRVWLLAAARKEKKSVGEINYIFCSDAILSRINKDYLKHSTLTDIVTFDNSEPEGPIESDIYISVPRVIENSKKFVVPFEQELRRVMVHGLLHLVGYADKTAQQKSEMRKREDAYLSLF